MDYDDERRKADEMRRAARPPQQRKPCGCGGKKVPAMPTGGFAVGGVAVVEIG